MQIRAESDYKDYKKKKAYMEKGLSRRIKRHVKARRHEFFAVIQPGFEATALKELMHWNIGTEHRIATGGISFTSGLTDCYACCLACRTIGRLLMRIGKFRAEQFGRFRKAMAAIPWELYIADKQTISFSVSTEKSRLYHTGRLEQEAAEAIGERMSKYGLSVSVCPKSITGETVFCRLSRDICTVSVDASGEKLYRRGQKRLVTKAPIRETTAALILTEANIRQYNLLVDPMCGSGTFALEATGIASGALPGFDRRFCFMSWPVFKAAGYEYLKKQLFKKAAYEQYSLEIIASDIDHRAVSAASENLRGIGFSPNVMRLDFLKEQIKIPQEKRSLIVLNPPYGNRMKTKTIFGLYAAIGKRLKEAYPESGWAVIAPGIEAERALAIPYDRKIPFMNGGLPVAALFRDKPL